MKYHVFCILLLSLFLINPIFGNSHGGHHRAVKSTHAHSYRYPHFKRTSTSYGHSYKSHLTRSHSTYRKSTIYHSRKFLKRSSRLKVGTTAKNVHHQTKSIQPASNFVVNGRCQAITKSGFQCKRKAKPGSKYCWQHQIR
jgi:hypothetical protein